ncbi:MAG TPA: helix-turn-helix transcriptional regulator, partial [Acidimicrobiales bacterium]
ALLARRTAAGEATAPLAAAAATADQLGAGALRHEIGALAARARITLDGPDDEAEPDGWPAERLDLTPREQQVLDLLVEGATNREIGETLFISQKTASVHVSNIMAKLGVSTRVQAAAVADRARAEGA